MEVTIRLNSLTPHDHNTIATTAFLHILFLFSDNKGLENRSGMNYLFCLELIVKGFQHLRNFYFGANERYI